MKRFLSTIICLLIMVPIINVKAAGLECAGGSEKNAIDLKNVNDFPCTGIESENITYTNNGKDLSKYFKLRSSKDRIDIIDKTLTFSTELEYGLVVITDVDAKKSTTVFVKNPAYVKPSTTTTTTTTTTKPITTTTTKPVLEKDE